MRSKSIWRGCFHCSATRRQQDRLPLTASFEKVLRAFECSFFKATSGLRTGPEERLLQKKQGRDNEGGQAGLGTHTLKKG